MTSVLTSCKTTQKAQSVGESPLVHVVLFKLKTSMSDGDLKYFEKELWKMASIDVVKNLQIGKYEDLEDKRAMEDYQMIMYMEFRNHDDYIVYKNHPKHLLLKERSRDFLAGVPRTYHYVKQ